MALGFGVGAEQPEAPLGEGAPGGPGLLPGEQPPVVAVDPPRPAADAGQVAAGVGLGPPLAPDLLARGHRREEPPPAAASVPNSNRVGASRNTPFWLTRVGACGPPVLLLEDQPLDDPHAPAAVLLGPRDHRPPVGVHGLLPGAVGLEPRGGVEGGQGARRRGRARPATRAPRCRNASCSSVNRRSIAASMVGRSPPRGRIEGNLTHRQISGNQGRSATMEPCRAP